jgi:hypothetical protein
VSLGFGLPLRGISKKAIVCSLHSITFSSCFALTYLFPLVRALVDPFLGLHLISWEEGAKGLEGKSKLVKDKSLKIKP